jgi:hypothetical protein
MLLDFLRENRADIAEAVEAGLIDLEQGFNLAMREISKGYNEAINSTRRGYGTAIKDVNQGYNEAIKSSDRGYNRAIAELNPLTGLQEYNQARGLLEDPSSLAERPSYQFQFDQGIEAMQGAFSRGSGGGLSGRGIQSAQEFGQNLASTALDAELNRLFPFINTAVQARANTANLEVGRGTDRANLQTGRATSLSNLEVGRGTGLANLRTGRATSLSNLEVGRGTGLANLRTNRAANLANMQAGRGSAMANLTLGGATGQANVSGQYAPGIAAGIQQQGTIQANQAIQGANVQTGLYSNLANVGTQFMNTAATNPGLFSSPASTPQPYNPWVTVQNPLGLTPGQGL